MLFIAFSEKEILKVYKSLIFSLIVQIQTSFILDLWPIFQFDPYQTRSKNNEEKYDSYDSAGIMAARSDREMFCEPFIFMFSQVQIRPTKRFCSYFTTMLPDCIRYWKWWSQLPRGLFGWMRAPWSTPGQKIKLYILKSLKIYYFNINVIFFSFNAFAKV